MFLTKSDVPGRHHCTECAKDPFRKEKTLPGKTGAARVVILSEDLLCHSPWTHEKNTVLRCELLTFQSAKSGFCVNARGAQHYWHIIARWWFHVLQCSPIPGEVIQFHMLTNSFRMG